MFVKSSNRVHRVSNEIRKSLSVIFQCKIRDPRMAGAVIVLRVHLSKDLSYAKVFITFCYQYTQVQLNEKMEILRSASGFVRYLLSKAMFFRTVPELFFIYVENSCIESMRVYYYLNSMINATNMNIH